MPKSYRAYVGTPLPDYCKTKGWLPECVGLNPPSNKNKPDEVVNTGERWFAPSTIPNDYSTLRDKWFSTEGNTKIKDENKTPVTMVRTSGGRNQTVTGATSHDVDTSGDSLQKYMPYIVAGGAGLMLVMMMFSMM